MKKTILSLFLIASSVLGCFANNFSSYCITEFGAVNDGVTMCTKAINTAIETCHKSGGGVVVVPSGTFKSGTILMKDNVELHLKMGSTLLASTDHADFPRQPQPEFRSQKDPAGWYALIYAEGASNIAITGLGTIDGNGAQQKPVPGLLGSDRDGRPRNILFISCKHIRVEGIKMTSSGIWNQHYLNCEDVIVDRVEVYNHSNRNNDAIDIDGCRRFVLSNSILDSDDDGITLKSTGAAAAEDVVISNCIVSSFCNAIKAGTESTGGFKNIAISNCVIKPSRCKSKPVFETPSRGITGISLEIVDGGTMEGVTINNVSIEGTECPIYIRLGNRARKHTESASEPKVGKMKNINISNVVARNSGNFSSSITAIPGYYIENVTLNNLQLFNSGGLTTGEYISDLEQVDEDENGYPQPTVWGNLPSSVLFMRHVKNIVVTNLMFGHKKSDLRIPIIADDVKNMRIGKTLFTGSSIPESFVLLKDVEMYDVEKPLGWSSEKRIEELR